MKKKKKRPLLSKSVFSTKLSGHIGGQHMNQWLHSSFADLRLLVCSHMTSHWPRSAQRDSCRILSFTPHVHAHIKTTRLTTTVQRAVATSFYNKLITLYQHTEGVSFPQAQEAVPWKNRMFQRDSPFSVFLGNERKRMKTVWWSYGSYDWHTR